MARELPGPDALIVLGIFSTPLCFKNALRPLGFFLFGFCWAGWQAHSVVDNQVPESFLGQDLTLSVTVHNLVKRDSDRLVFDAILEGRPSEIYREISEKKVRLSWYGDTPNMAIGERWRLVVRLKRPRGYRNKTSFDYERYLFAKQITAKG
ncbi:MAG: ComEC/Rec2 family competence protein, partial [Gammaproteobacteria bacterium]